MNCLKSIYMHLPVTEIASEWKQIREGGGLVRTLIIKVKSSRYPE